MKSNFTIRVYGLILKENHVLISSESYKNQQMVKFPGGGLEFGEGTADCILREMKEEFNLDIEVIDHFYTTDFFVSSAFHANTQVISIYYQIAVKNEVIPVDQEFSDEAGVRKLVWRDLAEIHPEDLTFPIDQKVVKMLKSKYLD